MQMEGRFPSRQTNRRRNQGGAHCLRHKLGWENVAVAWKDDWRRGGVLKRERETEVRPAAHRKCHRKWRGGARRGREKVVVGGEGKKAEPRGGGVVAEVREAGVVLGRWEAEAEEEVGVSVG